MKPIAVMQACSLLVAVAGLSPAATRAAEPARQEFTTLVAHWAEYSDPGYLAFIRDARPDVAQVGFYGAHFWSLAHTPHGKGYPAHFPVVGLEECGDWFERLNARVHQEQVKVVGHFNARGGITARVTAVHQADRP